MRNNKNVMVALALVAIASMLLAACGGGQPVEVTRIVEVAGTPQVEVVTATPEPKPVEPKTMVVCMAQEPQTLYVLSESALVKVAVLEAVYDAPGGFDLRSYDYQAVAFTKLSNFDDGDAKKEEVEVKVGDMVYNAADDSVVEITKETKVTLNQVVRTQKRVT